MTILSGISMARATDVAAGSEEPDTALKLDVRA